MSSSIVAERSSGDGGRARKAPGLRASRSDVLSEVIPAPGVAGESRSLKLGQNTSEANVKNISCTMFQENHDVQVCSSTDFGVCRAHTF